MLLIITVLSSAAIAGESSLTKVIIPAPSLSNNLIDTALEQKIAVYLPPSYDDSDTQYPVLYFLCGFGGEITNWMTGFYQGFSLDRSMDTLIEDGVVDEMIVVIISGKNIFGGSFYVNSPVTGNWDDFVTRDIVGYLDDNYRTIPIADSRGIAGFSMGGYGALNLGMLHPDVFSSVYAMSPGLFDQEGLANCQIFSSEKRINTFIDKQEYFSTFDSEQGLIKLKSYMNVLNSNYDGNTPFTYAYGAAFSAEVDLDVPYIKYPYSLASEELVIDETYWNNFEGGFGGVDNEIELYKENLLSLNGLVVDYGTSDFYRWIPEGCVYFAERLENANIPHELKTYAGNHGDKNRERMEDHVLPFFSGKLNRSYNVGVEDTDRTDIRDFRLDSNSPNPFNPATVIPFRLNAAGEVRVAVYDTTGRLVETLASGHRQAGNHSVNFDGSGKASGIYFCRMAFNGMQETRKMMLMK